MAKEGESVIGATWSSQNLAKLVGMSDEDREESNMKAASTIQLCLLDEVMYNVMDEETTTGLWSMLETLHDKEPL